MYRGEHKVPSKGRIDGDLSGFLVTNFADHDLIRIVAKNGSKAAGKCETLFLVHRNLGDAAHLIFTGSSMVMILSSSFLISLIAA